MEAKQHGRGCITQLYTQLSTSSFSLTRPYAQLPLSSSPSPLSNCPVKTTEITFCSTPQPCHRRVCPGYQPSIMVVEWENLSCVYTAKTVFQSHHLLQHPPRHLPTHGGKHGQSPLRKRVPMDWWRPQTRILWMFRFVVCTLSFFDVDSKFKMSSRRRKLVCLFF